MNNKYHIDVTPEEDTLFKEEENNVPLNKQEVKKNINFFKNKIFWGVVSIHVGLLAILTVSAAPQKDKTVSENVIAEDKTFIKENTVQPLSTPEPTPFPTPQFNEPIDRKPEPTSFPTPQFNEPIDRKPEPASQPIKHIHKEDKKIISKTPSSNILTKNYTIKNGDTIFSIAKKYKLNYDRLIKINNIKDPNKIKIGETLKFM
jgi:LysM repeat protein